MNTVQGLALVDNYHPGAGNAGLTDGALPIPASPAKYVEYQHVSINRIASFARCPAPVSGHHEAPPITLGAKSFQAHTGGRAQNIANMSSQRIGEINLDSTREKLVTEVTRAFAGAGATVPPAAVAVNRR